MKKFLSFLASHPLAITTLLMCLTVSSHAGTDKLSCGYKLQQQYLGALPEFKANTQPLLGYRCDLKPHTSSFLGNWFPSLPNIMISQTNRQLGDDFNQAWQLSLAIKRMGQGQFYLAAGQDHWQQVLTSKESIPFVASNASTPSDTTLIADDQKVRLSHKKTLLGAGFRFAYQENQPLTELAFQQVVIDQPVQANVIGFEKRSLYQAMTEISEISIISESYHRGLNINWQFALGIGQVKLKPENMIPIEKDKNQVLALKGIVEVYYQYRINRRWFGYSSWIGKLHYWQQASNEESFELAPNDQAEHQFQLGLGLSL